MVKIHKANSLPELYALLSQFQKENYAYISYLAGEYGITINIYKTYVYNFFQEMQKQNIKTVAFVFKNMKSFVYNCCDEIIEYQDIEFEDNDTIINSLNNIVPNISYDGNDGWALQYIRGITCKKYEDLLDHINFANIFYTLHLDGSRHINKNDGCVFDGGINLYKINNQNCVLYNILNSTNTYCLIDKQSESIKTKQISIWIRKTNKWENRNMLPETYNTVFNYCIENKITCNVFMDLIQIDLPYSEFIINRTDRFKNRPNWDGFFEILTYCDLFIGSDSGSSEFVLLTHRINCLFDRDIRNQKHLTNIIDQNRKQGLLCNTIHFPNEFASIMKSFYI